MHHWWFYKLDGTLKIWKEKQFVSFNIESSEKVRICLILVFINCKANLIVVYQVFISFEIKYFRNDFQYLTKINQVMSNGLFFTKGQIGWNN